MPIKKKQRRPKPVNWGWEKTPELKEFHFIGRCRSRQGIALFIRFEVDRATRAAMKLYGQDKEVKCRHCGGRYESVREIRLPAPAESMDSFRVLLRRAA